MFVEKEFFIGLSDLINGTKLKNTSLLSFLEDMGGIHSNMVGNGLYDIERTKQSWVLLSWKVKLYKRPMYAENIRIKTWSRKMDKLYAYRDYEIFNDKNECIGIATSRWILIDIESRKILKLDEALEKQYTKEDIDITGVDTNFGKLKEPENYTHESEFKITKNLIDINNHVHNLYYMDIASEVIPEDILKTKELNDFEVMYKKEIIKDEIVKCLFVETEESYIVTIKSKDNSVLHAIIKFNKE